MRVIVTRPAAQAGPWVEGLRGAGIDAVALPLIDIAALDDLSAVQAAWSGLADIDLVMFVSANAVGHFFAARPPGLDWPPALQAGSTGPGTSAALRAAGLTEAQIVEPAADAPVYDSEALWARLCGRAWAGRRALVVRGEDGRDWFADTLRRHGAQVDFVAAYRRAAPQPDAAGCAVLAAALAAPASHLWLFSSSEAVGRLRTLAPGADWSGARALASHPRIAQAARELGFGRVDAVAPQLPAVVAAMLSAGEGGR